MRLAAAAAAQYCSDGDPVPATACTPKGGVSRTTVDDAALVGHAGSEVALQADDDGGGGGGSWEGDEERARMSLMLCGVVVPIANSCATALFSLLSSERD